MIKAKVTATGSYLPKKIVTNNDFVEEFGNETSPEALERLLGTREHRVAADNEWCADLLVKAAEDILHNANLTSKDLSRIFVSVTPGDYIEPATSPIVHAKLGAQCPAMDIKVSCVGWLAALDVAMQYLANPENKDECILVLAGALMSRTLPARKVQHRAIFGDGAGGILLQRASADETSCIYGSEFMVLGKYADVICWPAPWSNHPDGYFDMGSSKLLFRLLQRHMQTVLKRLWEKTGFSPSDVDFAVIHQPTGPLFEVAVKHSSIDPCKIARNFASYGNTVSAELPITLDKAIDEGKIKRGDLVLLVTYGAGITGGCMLLRY